MSLLHSVANKFIDKVRNERVITAETQRDEAYGAVLSEAGHRMGSVMHREAAWNGERQKYQKTIRLMGQECSKRDEELVLLRDRVTQLEAEIRLMTETWNPPASQYEDFSE